MLLYNACAWLILEYNKIYSHDFLHVKNNIVYIPLYIMSLHDLLGFMEMTIFEYC